MRPSRQSALKNVAVLDVVSEAQTPNVDQACSTASSCSTMPKGDEIIVVFLGKLLYRPRVVWYNLRPNFVCFLKCLLCLEPLTQGLIDLAELVF